MLSSPSSAIKAFESKLSKSTASFSNMSSFPLYHGLYFVYLENQVIYIGKADKQPIRKRCEQYVGTSTGATLRLKIEKATGSDKQGSIAYISKNLKARFIELGNLEQIPVLEEIAIWAFQPKLNVIKPKTFRYELTNFS